MMEIKKISYILVIIGILIPATIFAQGDIDDAEVVFYRERNIQLPKAEREFPVLEFKKQQIKTDRKFDYQAKDFDATLGPVNTDTKVLRLKKDKIKKLYSSYLNVGFGNYATSLLKYNFANRRSDKSAFGVNVDHISSLRGPVDNSSTSDNELNVYGIRFFEGKQLGFNATYELNRFKYYGYNHDDANLIIDKYNVDSITQVMNHVGFDLNFRNEENKKLYYNAKVLLNYFSPSFLSEMKIGYGLETKYNLDESMHIALNSDFSKDRISNSDTTVQRYILKTTAGLNYTKAKVDAFVGLKVASNTDSVQNDKMLHVYPEARVSYTISDKTKAFAGLSGDLNRNNLESMLIENPYLDSTVTIYDDNKLIDFNIGIKQSLGTGLFLTAKGGVARFENLHMFGTGALDSTRFNMIWNTGNVLKTYLVVRIEQKIKGKMLTGFDVEFNHYSIDNYDHVYYRPGLLLGTFVKYNLRDKIEAEFNGKFLSNYYSYDLLKSNEQSMDNIIDLRLKLKYNMSPKLSFYVVANNLIAKKYQYYINYPKKGFNFIAGINYSF